MCTQRIVVTHIQGPALKLFTVVYSVAEEKEIIPVHCKCVADSGLSLCINGTKLF